MSFRIAFVEELTPNDPLLVQEEGRWIGNSLGAALGFMIPNSIGVDRPAVFIGEQQERNLVPGLHALQHFH